MAADLIKDNVLSAYLGASAPAEQENDAEPRGFAGDSDLQARSAARPEVSRLASANASACRVCRSCSACAASTAQQRRRLLILCAGLLPGAQIAERVGRALALLARTKVRSPARPRARHPAPCPAPRSPCPRAPLSALARRSRYSPCPPVPVAGARRPRPQAPRMPGRGAGAARARASQAGWCFCGDLAACEAAAAAESPAAAAVVTAVVAAAMAIVAALAIAPAACPRAAIDARAAVASLAPAGARPVSATPRPPQPSNSNARPSPQPSPPLLPPPRQRSSPPSPTLPSVGACRRASWAPFRPSSENLGTFWESSHICDEV